MQIQPTSPEQPTVHAPADWFTGDVWFDVVAAPPAPSRLRVSTHWHVHSEGQTLHVTQGAARVGTRDGRVLELRPGQTVWCPPGEWHWHGAGPDAFMEHLAMWETTEARDGSETTWGEPVTDEQYSAPAEVRS
jgi:quercetin dioxygenase-like cupin family protein